ncbi:hypothetical protein H6G54_18000 [Anabaena cylindrica FACHB-243]|uniref:hypothetical protein n=1 Tax=Anabaena TaxID=1163 RepID=UPI00031C7E93|nr:MULTISPECIES: hypothetical protein [Anabaena]MBD2419560.1 hypothetical protein [Anabaena cylindrica FACHB-243]MBY5284169.1 hypothetical protein [Anabaena sp. CCAP 1446/1C]MBY5309328.1 hypothetical protein [Anabaena sp. CCAP 1446/1C]MCM2409761.1 hypothetical protein [Anabaena sp. CCAP 1446/1C]
MQGYETQHIKNEGAKLWRILSEALGEKVTKTNFQAALERRTQLFTTSSQIILDINIEQDEIDAILGLFSIRDSAVLDKNKEEFLKTQVNKREIKGGASKGYISCSKITTYVLQIGVKPNKATFDTCSPSGLFERERVVYLVKVKEDYEHDNNYTHSGYISYFLTKTDEGFRIIDLYFRRS